VPKVVVINKGEMKLLKSIRSWSLEEREAVVSLLQFNIHMLGQQIEKNELPEGDTTAEDWQHLISLVNNFVNVLKELTNKEQASN